MFSQTNLISLSYTTIDITTLATRLVNSSEDLAYLTEVIVFIVSLVYCRKRGAPAYMKGLPFYFFVSTVTEIVALSFHRQMIFIYWAFNIYENIFFLLFFKLLVNVYSKLRFSFYIGLVIMQSAVIFLLTFRTTSGLEAAIMFSSVEIVVPCIVYFRRLMVYPIVIPLEKDPAFWMVTGIFFYFLIRLPVIWYHSYFLAIGKPLLAMTVYSIQNYALTIAQLLFIKAMTCLKKRTC